MYQTRAIYDTDLTNKLHFKKKKGAKHEFGTDYEPIIPKEGEVRLLGNRNNQCNYYSIGVELCQQEVLKNKD